MSPTWNFHSQFSQKKLLLCSVCSMRLADHRLHLRDVLDEGRHVEAVGKFLAPIRDARLAIDMDVP